MPKIMWKTKFNFNLNAQVLVVCIVPYPNIVIIYIFEISNCGISLIFTSWAIPWVCATSCLRDWHCNMFPLGH
jgi:hypothetical protein